MASYDTKAAPNLVNHAAGIEFQVGDQPISVTDLGVYDAESDGLWKEIEVTIWTESGQTVIAQTTIPRWNQEKLGDSDVYGRFIYMSITPVRLDPGGTYVISATSTEAGDAFIDQSQIGSFKAGSGVSLLAGRYGEGDGCPMGRVPKAVFGAANFMYDVINKAPTKPKK